MQAIFTIRALLRDGIERCPPEIRRWAVSPREMMILLDIAEAAWGLAGRMTPDERDRKIEVLLATCRVLEELYGEDEEVTEPMPVAMPDDLTITSRGGRP